MLAELGFNTVDELIDRVVPPAIRTPTALALPPALSEVNALARLAAMAEKNQTLTTMIGMGYYGTHTPSVILRNVLENPAWYTAYTPYQAEVSQGRLEALLNYQQTVMDLTGFDLANASLLDEGTAVAEAVAMAHRVSKSKSDVFLIDELCHAQTLAVVRTRADALGIEMRTVSVSEELIDTTPCFAVVVQYPNAHGAVRSWDSCVEAAHRHGALAVVATDLLALTLLRSPGDFGADVAVGSAQRFGVPMGFGGPHAAFFATRDEYRRSVPGRIIGVSKDAHGAPAYRMALQTREQHIRREKATSNICTAQVLLAVMAGFYAVYHGSDGLRAIAGRVHKLAQRIADGLTHRGFTLAAEQFFDTVTVSVPGTAKHYLEQALQQGINLGQLDGDHVTIACDETTTDEQVQKVLAVFTDDCAAQPSEREPKHFALKPDYLRDDEILTHPVFSRYRSETEMLRYLRSLSDKDLALDRAMIPLGSCTMKLNATTEMMPVTWDGFSRLHPFAPTEQVKGYLELFQELEAWLCESTGFDAVSLQPNAGSQGEFAGLLVIRAYHASRGESARDICLIPASAHGTNPASAKMAGMEVVVVACDDAGNIDVSDLKSKAEAAGERLSALMITYPSTHGVFETQVKDICSLIHMNGGQVYMDGANLNALLGVCRPGEMGADVSHMNLHKTFCIPHGGGGPGMGPIGVMAHLAPFLPGHPVHDPNPGGDQGGRDSGIGPISAAPWGSASILPISWAYAAMMGGDGLLRATQFAILSANYIAHRLAPHFPILYTGEHGLVAHECIIDLRWLKGATGLTVDDVAKRLVDYGFHAPTMSFPVPETLMIEPTESESLEELDGFIDAMQEIRKEALEEADLVKSAPHSLPVRRLDDVRAARQLDVV
ncbi:MAG: aminomethyl-transferring glycine dehydrogenase, partial [Gammaproteobacteria bacterium]|nr:aminomethyl-transferring glycine dehydrogenase [Gammaproteobacteria bacterium]